MREFYGYRYDEKKLNNYEEKVEEKEANNWNAIPFMEEAMEDNGRYISLSTCACCGRVIQNSYFGYGSKCFEMVLKSINVIAKISTEFEKLLSEYNLKKWQYYTEIVKKIYIEINSKPNGELKKFRNEFKKSFVQSMLNCERISRKQLNIMLKDIDNYSYYNSGVLNYSPEFIDNLIKEKKMPVIKAINYEKYENLIKDFNNLLNTGDVTTFVRITYCKAWLDNPFHEEKAA